MKTRGADLKPSPSILMMVSQSVCGVKGLGIWLNIAIYHIKQEVSLSLSLVMRYINTLTKECFLAHVVGDLRWTISLLGVYQTRKVM